MSNEMRHESASDNVGGEIVEVEGGHIVRSTGRKDRHSKVCTAKGPRDRRVRLSAPTAIQFYDVQDRLGFDRPSKAVDWLINKAKSAIDDLDQLPPWNPVDTLRQHAEMVNSRPRRRTSKTETETEQNHHQNETSFLLPASLDSDSIADTIKSFFPVAPPQSYHHHQPPPPSSDLRLSLQSFQNGESFGSQTEHALFSGQSNPLGFDSSWEQNQHQSPEFGKIQRVMTWNNGGVSEGGFVSASPVAATTSYQPVYGQSQHFSTQRGPLQSINTPMIRGWFDPNHHHHHHNHNLNHQSITSDDLQHHQQHQNQPYHVPSAIPGIAFASNGEFSGFRIHQDDNKPSSASSDSRH